jgi:hypothetical protein
MHATGRTVLAASSDKEPAIEGYENHGVFTYSLLKGLKGEADAQKTDGVIYIDELANFLRDNVPLLTQKKWGYEQIPMRNLQGDPFPIGCAEGRDCENAR